MIIRVPVLAACATLLAGPALYAQHSGDETGPYPAGLTLALGSGRYSVRDEYLSSERYSGTLPQLRAGWARLSGATGFRMAVEYRRSTEISNHNVAAGITQFSLDLDYMYRVGRASILSREVRFYLGPTAGFLMYVNEPDIASNGLDLALSFAALFSAGVNSYVTAPLVGPLYGTGLLRVNVLSLGLRIVDLMEDDESPVNLLTPVSETNGVAGLGLHFAPLDRLTLGVSYELQVLSIRPWDELVSASNNIIAALTIRL